MYKPEKILNDLLLYIWFCATGTIAIGNSLGSGLKNKSSGLFAILVE